MSTRTHRPAAAADVTADVPFVGAGVAIAEGWQTGQRDVVRRKGEVVGATREASKIPPSLDLAALYNVRLTITTYIVALN